jgi:hypothetical protein
MDRDKLMTGEQTQDETVEYMQFVCWILPWSYAAVRKSKPCMNHSTWKERFPLADGRLILNSYDEDSVENNKL